MYSKMKKKYHIVGTTPKSNIIVVERGKIDTPSTKQNKTVHFVYKRSRNNTLQNYTYQDY